MLIKYEELEERYDKNFKINDDVLDLIKEGINIDIPVYDSLVKEVEEGTSFLYSLFVPREVLSEYDYNERAKSLFKKNKKLQINTPEINKEIIKKFDLDKKKKIKLDAKKINSLRKILESDKYNISRDSVLTFYNGFDSRYVRDEKGNEYCKTDVDYLSSLLEILGIDRVVIKNGEIILWNNNIMGVPFISFSKTLLNLRTKYSIARENLENIKDKFINDVYEELSQNLFFRVYPMGYSKEEVKREIKLNFKECITIMEIRFRNDPKASLDLFYLKKDFANYESDMKIIEILDDMWKKQNNIEVTNSNEKENRETPQKYKAIFINPKNPKITFELLKELAENYVLESGFKRYRVLSRASKEEVTEPILKTAATFANIWLLSAGIKYDPQNPESRIEYAFSEQSKEAYEIIKKACKKDLEKYGYISSEEIVKEFYSNNITYKHFNEIVSNLFGSRYKADTVEYFFRLITPRAQRALMKTTVLDSTQDFRETQILGKEVMLPEKEIVKEISLEEKFVAIMKEKLNNPDFELKFSKLGESTDEIVFQKRLEKILKLLKENPDNVNILEQTLTELYGILNNSDIHKNMDLLKVINGFSDNTKTMFFGGDETLYSYFSKVYELRGKGYDHTSLGLDIKEVSDDSIRESIDKIVNKKEVKTAYNEEDIFLDELGLDMNDEIVGKRK